MEPIISLENVALTYQADNGEVEALRGVSFQVEKGEFISIVGPSGCGKSTLLGVIAGLEKADAGEVQLCGKPVDAAGFAVGLMPQQDHLLPWRSIRSNVMLGLEIRGLDDEEHRQKIDDLLMRYGLADFARKYPDQLSGGMRQRCALIRTLATEPEILLLDESFSALDYQTRLQVSSDIWRIIRAEGKTAVLVTHDISEAISLSDRVIVLSRRPAGIKASLTLDGLRGLTPMERRESPVFTQYFDRIWKELELDGS